MFRKSFFYLIIVLIFFSCKKNTAPGNPDNYGGDTTIVPTYPPVDPEIAGSIGFFLDNWEAKNLNVPEYIDTGVTSKAATVTVTIDPYNIITKVPPTVFGQNANIWMTQMVTEASLLNNLTNLHPHLIRFPGGSLSDMYFWNAIPGNPPADAPALLTDANGAEFTANYWFGKNTASWTISLDNYYQMLQATGNEGMITINYGYARYSTSGDPVASAAHLAADWIRYDNGRTKYWEIGNENNGTWEAGYRINTATNQDGQPQIITGDVYARHVKVFVDSMKKAAQGIGKTIYIGAQLLEKQPESWQTPTDQNWNSAALSALDEANDFFIIHSYYTPYQQNSSADVILNTAISNTASMMKYVSASISSAGAMKKPIALTEWNITSQGSQQQVSFINGMHAALLLGEALKNKYGETSRWDLANAWENGNDHGLFNNGDEPGVIKWNPRPAFYYMYFFQQALGDRLINSTVTGSNEIFSYGSSYSSGEKGVIIINKGSTAQVVKVNMQNARAGKRFYWYTLSGGSDNGEFSNKVFVNGWGPSEPSGGPANYNSIKAYSALTQNKIILTVPSRSVVYVIIDKK